MKFYAMSFDAARKRMEIPDKVLDTAGFYFAVFGYTLAGAVAQVALTVAAVAILVGERAKSLAAWRNPDSKTSHAVMRLADKIQPHVNQESYW